MKFGRKLQESAHPAFRNYYIAYKDLKEAIKIITGEAVVSDDLVGAGSPILELLRRSAESSVAEKGGIVRTPESQFQELLDHELAKINSFSNVQFSVMLEEIREIVYRLTHEGTTVGQSIENLRQEIVAFDEYLRLNFSGFRKALKKFDKWNKSDSSNWFLQRIVRSDFMLIQIDRLLHGLALIEDLRKNRYESVNGASTDGIACFARPSMFRRIKYFVAPEDLVEIETELLKSASALVAYPLTQSVPATAAAAAERFRSGRHGTLSAGEFSFVESAVIFDNEDLAQYSARRSKKAVYGVAGGYTVPVFSVRWNQFQHKEGKCLMVRESHQRSEENGGLFELEVRQRNLLDLISGKLNVASFISSENLRADSSVSEFLSGFIESARGTMKPVALFNYRRSLFKAGDVMVAVDKDIKFLDLKPMDGSLIFSIPSTQFQAILVQRTVTVWVPRSQASIPPFIETIAGKPGVSEVSGFSKAIHAEAVLHVVTELERPLSVGLPSWFVHTVAGEDNKELKFVSAAADDDRMASPLASAASIKFDVLPLAKASSRLLIHDIVAAKEPKQITPAPLPSLPATTPLVGTELQAPLLDRQTQSAGRQRIKSQSIWDQIKYVLFGSAVPEISEPVSKIEPKTFLANERTFLNWAYLAFILAAVAVTLASVDPTAHLEASLLSLAAVVTLGWSLNIYRLRVIALRNMKALETLMVSSNGATMVCLLVAFALAMTWIGRFRQYLETLS